MKDDCCAVADSTASQSKFVERIQCPWALLQQVYDLDMGKFLQIVPFFSGKENDENMTIYAISKSFPWCFTFSTQTIGNPVLYCCAHVKM